MGAVMMCVSVRGRGPAFRRPPTFTLVRHGWVGGWVDLPSSASQPAVYSILSQIIITDPSQP